MSRCLSRSFGLITRPSAACFSKRLQGWNLVLPDSVGHTQQTLHQFALHGIEPCLRALLVLVGCAAADADAADLHLVRGHDRKPPGKSNDAWKIGDTGDDAGFPVLAEGQFAFLPCREGKVGRSHSLVLSHLDTS